MSRLTIRNSDGSVSQPMNLRWADALEKLAHYEDLEEQGRLVVLPCVLGTTLYSIFAAVHNLLRNGEDPIREIRMGEDNVYSIVRHFGKTVFLTHPEAEAALAASGKEG